MKIDNNCGCEQSKVSRQDGVFSAMGSQYYHHNSSTYFLHSWAGNFVEELIVLYKNNYISVCALNGRIAIKEVDKNDYTRAPWVIIIFCN